MHPRTLVDRGGAALVLLAPFVLAFFSGGYFDGGRLVAATVVWVGVAFVALSGSVPVPRAAPGRLALVALTGLTAWALLAVGWAPGEASALDAMQRALLYTGVVALAAATLRDRPAADALLPVVAVGCLVVVGYGLSARLLPGVIDLTESFSAAGRLEQPLTYWNAEGLMAALGVVACVALAAEPDRPFAVRAAALPVAVILALGLWLTYSRGALVAVTVGVLAVIALGGGRAALRAAAVVAALAVPLFVLANVLDGVRQLTGSAETREAQGAAVLAAVFLAAVAAWRAAGWVVAAARTPLGLMRLGPGRVAAGLAVVVVLGIAGAVALDRGPAVGTPTTGATADRLASADSNRYAYWKVAAGAWADRPLVGNGGGSFEVLWGRERTIDDVVRNAHSLPLQTLAEFGLVGLALLLAFLAALGGAGRRAARRVPLRVAGPAAIVVTWLVHACIDWDWEMPSVTMVAMVAAGALVGWGDAEPTVQPGEV